MRLPGTSLACTAGCAAAICCGGGCFAGGGRTTLSRDGGSGGRDVGDLVREHDRAARARPIKADVDPDDRAETDNDARRRPAAAEAEEAAEVYYGKEPGAGQLSRRCGAAALGTDAREGSREQEMVRKSPCSEDGQASAGQLAGGHRQGQGPRRSGVGLETDLGVLNGTEVRLLAAGYEREREKDWVLLVRKGRPSAAAAAEKAGSRARRVGQCGIDLSTRGGLEAMWRLRKGGAFSEAQEPGPAQDSESGQQQLSGQRRQDAAQASGKEDDDDRHRIIGPAPPRKEDKAKKEQHEGQRQLTSAAKKDNEID